jgi:hypothetical protein
MKDFIDEKMHDIFSDFQESLQDLDKCCILKSVTFLGGNIPDYSIPAVQQFYLLKYFPAYLVEYYTIYNKILKLKFIKDNLNVLSIGTGCGVDYCGLEFALREHGMNASSHAFYTGVDIIRWKYRDKFDNEDCHFLLKDITDWDKLDEEDYNVVIFPKSIGEFSQEQFLKIISTFENTKFASDRIILISSVREQSDSFDIPRLARIISVFEDSQKYVCLDERDTCTKFVENVGLRKYFPDFVFPQDILDFIANLVSRCKGFQENSKTCEDDCQNLNRSPILRTKHIRYQIKRLQKQV